MTDPVYNRAEEEAVIGCALAGYRDLDDLDLHPNDFYVPAHGDLWAAILRVHDAGNVPDVGTVRFALGANGSRVDPVRLLELSQSAPVFVQAPWYAERVKHSAARRRLQEAGTKITHLGTIGEADDLPELQDRARQALEDATAESTRTELPTIADLLPEVLDVAQRGQTATLPTCWPDIDRLIGGLAPGRLVVVGARPGAGKSIAGTNLALHFAGHHQHQALIASLEMPRTEVMQRMLAAHARVNLSSLTAGTVDEASWGRIAECNAELSAMPIFIEDHPHLSIAGLRRAAREAKRKRGDLALIVVDYLQLMATSSGGRGNTSRAEQVGELSRGLKLVAREFDACVVAMAQVNREGTRHSDGKPRLSDLRESGSIEADADQVILLHRPDEELPEVEAIVAKNRWGPMGVAQLQMHGHYARLESVTWTPSRSVAG